MISQLKYYMRMTTKSLLIGAVAKRKPVGTQEQSAGGRLVVLRAQLQVIRVNSLTPAARAASSLFWQVLPVQFKRFTKCIHKVFDGTFGVVQHDIAANFQHARVGHDGRTSWLRWLQVGNIWFHYVLRFELLNVLA